MHTGANSTLVVKRCSEIDSQSYFSLYCKCVINICYIDINILHAARHLSGARNSANSREGLIKFNQLYARARTRFNSALEAQFT